jgi:choline dehydrogenase-like flavoprotein
LETLCHEAEVAVVGSGPGGATVARELARAGVRVALLERGHDHRRSPYYGTHLGAALYADRHALFFTREGLQVVRPIMVGGATSMYCGSAALPPLWLRDRYGLDVERQAREAAEELRVAPLPPELRGSASTRIAEAASSLGQEWQPQLKLLDPGRAKRFRCGAKCMLGCRCGAKWTAAEWVDEAVAAGADLYTDARVTEVMRSGTSVAGVRALWQGRILEVEAPVVVVAAGGLGTPELLRRSGLPEAGRGMAMDTTAIVYGRSRYPGVAHEPPMTWSFTDAERRFMLSTLADPWLLYPVIAALGRPRDALSWPYFSRMLGVMIKLKDEVGGELLPGGGVSKPLSVDEQRQLDHAVGVARRILARAGASPESVFVSPLRGTHPSATVRVGEMLDRDLQTSLAGLYVCDASVFPEALGQPTVLTIIALGRRLAEHLTAGARG